MFRIAAIVGGVLLMAGVALAGTVTGLDSSNSPSLGTLPSAAATTTTGPDDSGPEAEVRGRATEAGEDLRGPCDEAEHATNPRCTGAPAARAGTVTTRLDDDRHGSNGPGGGDDHGDRSGRGGGDEGGHSGHGGGHGRDD
jgi:hypothetical protein